MEWRNKRIRFENEFPRKLVLIKLCITMKGRIEKEIAVAPLWMNRKWIETSEANSFKVFFKNITINAKMPRIRNYLLRIACVTKHDPSTASSYAAIRDNWISGRRTVALSLPSPRRDGISARRRSCPRKSPRRKASKRVSCRTIRPHYCTPVF